VVRGVGKVVFDASNHHCFLLDRSCQMRVLGGWLGCVFHIIIIIIIGDTECDGCTVQWV